LNFMYYLLLTCAIVNRGARGGCGKTIQNRISALL
jgi:hypothetical protein